MTDGGSGAGASNKGRWLPWLVGGIPLACFVAAASVLVSGGEKTGPRPSPPPQAETVKPPAEKRSTRRRRVISLNNLAPRQPRLEIPAIDVDAKVIELGLRRDGSLEVPTDYSEVGWWAGGPRPGDDGPAVMTGHVDSRKTGPGVFYRLGELDAGDEVRFVRPSGARVRFIVERSERYPKDHFPTLRVYGQTDGPELRLITCTGDFDTGSGHYLDNLVVFARPATQSN